MPKYALCVLELGRFFYCCSKIMTSEDDYHSRCEKKKSILALMENGDWEGVLEQFDHVYREPLLVWVRPSREMLRFLESCLKDNLGISKITSIGSGCAFLEWLIVKATSLQVQCIEVNSSWWKSSHSTPQFVPLDFTEPGQIPKLDPNSALFFCYFNHLEYFHQYLDSYLGNCVVLVGPVDGKRHCDPEPNYLETLADKWVKFDQHDIRNASEDLVCVYVRK